MDKVPPHTQPEKEIRFPEISREINAMADTDQSSRLKALEQEAFWDESVDRDNAKRMKEIVAQIGWPSVSKVGKESAHNAWLLVQHADFDVAFQAECLALMRQESEGEVERIDIAKLEDRIRVNRNQPQVYGTQFEEKSGLFVPREIEDEATVDERRRQMGLGTLQEGINEMYEKYGTKKP